MNLLTRLRNAPSSERYSFDEYVADVAAFQYQGLAYQTPSVNQTWGKRPTEGPDGSFEGRVAGAYKSNGVVFACQMARLMLFTEARFMWQQTRAGRPGDLWWNSQLAVLEQPWVNGSTGDLLAKMIQDVDLVGNAFVKRTSPMAETVGLERLRPDWVTIILAGDRDFVNLQVVGYGYQEGGFGSKHDPVVFDRDEVAHWCPIPDPTATYRGMSWLSSVLREVSADSKATEHKLQFFDHAATPNMVVKFDPSVSFEAYEKFKSAMEAKHVGFRNAYKTMYLGGGADATTVGLDFKQMDFKATQGAGEPLALDTPIPTPTGWSTMGALTAGDYVIGSDGLPVRVAATSPVHEGRTCYRVTFNDRTSIVADAGHLWSAIDRNTKARVPLVYTTEEMRGLIEEWADKPQANRMGVPPADALKTPARDLLIDPYVLGAWLGDGATAGAAICGAPDDLAFIAAEIERRGYTTTKWNTDPEKVDVIGLPGGLLAALRAVGVLGDKRIPTDYLRASYEQRLDLLRGLMDTDGSVGHAGKETCEFSSKWEHLARQIADLTRSLGFRTTVSHKIDVRSRTGGTWRVTFRADPDAVPFLMPRKAVRCVTPLKVRNRAIVSIEPVESVPVRCISVESADHLFCAGEGWVLTHNTRIAAAAGVPPVIVGLSEGLQAATYSNYGQARRRFADMTMRPLWRSACAALETVIPAPERSRLWYDDRDIPALQEDQKDAADIEQVKATTIAALVREGFTPDSVVKAVTAQDMTLLEHTGRVSVQLLDPTAPADTGATP